MSEPAAEEHIEEPVAEPEVGEAGQDVFFERCATALEQIAYQLKRLNIIAEQISKKLK